MTRTPGAFPTCPCTEPTIRANAEAAWLAAREFGTDLDAARRAVAVFRPLPHRLETVAEIDGVMCVNDSKCTTPEALKVALAAFDRPVLLLAGGTYKGGDAAALGDLGAPSRQSRGPVRSLARQIRTRLEGPDPRHLGHPTLREALARLRGLARPGDVVLLAPATSSYRPQYANYKERGEDFRRAVLDRPAPAHNGGRPGHDLRAPQNFGPRTGQGTCAREFPLGAVDVGGRWASSCSRLARLGLLTALSASELGGR